MCIEEMPGNLPDKWSEFSVEIKILCINFHFLEIIFKKF